MRRLSIVLLLSGGCATISSTDYLAAERPGAYGYSEFRSAPNTYQVTFQGSQLAKFERVIDFAHLRSAEVILENGERYFVVERILDLTPEIASLKALEEDEASAERNAVPVIQITVKAVKDSTAYHAQFIRNQIRTKYKIHTR